MIDFQLFLGFPLFSSYKIDLEALEPALRSFFIQNHPDYLQSVEFNGIKYLGKPLPSLVELSDVELLEANIYSLLRQLVKDHPYQETALCLLALPINK